LYCVKEHEHSFPLRGKVGMGVGSLCPNADTTVFPWRDPAELKARTIEKVRRFLRAQVVT
jgi:hypothetical protein